MVETMMILTGAIVGLFLAGAGFFKTWMNSGEPISPVKAGATVITGGVVGAVMMYMGIPFLEENFWAQMGVFGVLTVVIEDLFKGLTRPTIQPITEGWTWTIPRGVVLYEANGWKVQLNPSIWVRHLPDEKVYQAISPRARWYRGRYSGDKESIELHVKSMEPQYVAWRQRNE